MHKQNLHSLFSGFLLLGLLYCYFLPMNVQAQVSREEEKFWKQKAKMYRKDPMALKAEFENYQQQIEDLKAQVRELMENQGGDSDEEAKLRMQLIELENSNERFQKENARLRGELASRNKVAEMGIRNGLIFRVQLVASVLNEFNAPGAVSDDVLVERSDGFNKFLIGGFRTYQEAEQFREEVRELGFDDAWIVPYIDGERVSMDEAEKYRQDEGQASFID